METQIVSAEELVRHLPPRIPPWVANGILSFTGMAELNRAYAVLGSSVMAHPNLFEEALARLNVHVDVSDDAIARIPERGPIIVVSNHPFGGIDGLALGASMLRRRSDVRILTNSVLSRITKLRPWFLDVEVFDSHQHKAKNARQLIVALRHLASGGMLVVFPAGEVSHFQPERGEITDDEWHPSIAMLARRSGAGVLPCFFAGANRPIFQAAGLLHPGLRTLLLPRELLARRGSRVRLEVGRRIDPNSLARFGDDSTLMAWLRMRCYDLQERKDLATRSPSLRPLATQVDARTVELELHDLPRRQCLLEQGDYQVFLALQSDIPRTVEEIARLRELTFRAVGEGTGAPRDLDVYDSRYHHLVLFDQTKHCVVGAYRLAFCDEVMKREGFDGLYTFSLFHFRAAMRKELRSSIELGRSFVRPEYQRKPLALAMLWRGIGEVLCRNPRYRRLVGPVSISGRIRGSARRLLIAFLELRHFDPSLSRLVESRHPVEFELDDTERQILSRMCKSVRDLARVIAELDDSNLRVPVLLERYLELGAKVSALSVDPQFGNCIDAFVNVDLDNAPEPTLRRFMGGAGLAGYQAAGRMQTASLAQMTGRPQK